MTLNRLVTGRLDEWRKIRIASLTRSGGRKCKLMLIEKGFKEEPNRGSVTELRSCVSERRGGRPGLSVLTSLLVSVDVKKY